MSRSKPASRFIRLSILILPLLLVTLLPSVIIHANPGPTNGVSNPGFENVGRGWDSNAQYGTVNLFDTTRAYSGVRSAKISAPANAGPVCSSGCGDIVAAFVGNPFITPQNYALINLVTTPASLTAWWYVDPTPRPYSLRILLLFTDGRNPQYTLGYYYGAPSAITSNSTRTVYYDLGPITTGGWFQTSRNVYSDLQPLRLTDLSTFWFSRVGLGAMGNYTNGETAWVDDVSLMFDRPDAAFTVTPLGGLHLGFDASPSVPSTGATITTYSWYFGDGATFSSSDSKSDHSYASAGSKNVTLVVVDSNGHISATSQFGTVSNDTNLPPDTWAYIAGLLLTPLILFGVFMRYRRKRRRRAIKKS